MVVTTMIPWIHNEYDQMEMGTTGWAPLGKGRYKNIYNNHTLDELGNEYDENNNLIFENIDPYGDENQ